MESCNPKCQCYKQFSVISPFELGIGKQIISHALRLRNIKASLTMGHSKKNILGLKPQPVGKRHMPHIHEGEGLLGNFQADTN